MFISLVTKYGEDHIISDLIESVEFDISDIGIASAAKPISVATNSYDFQTYERK